MRIIGQVLLGAAVSFAVLVALYGPSQAVMLLALVVVWTAGIGLVPIVFVSWIVGWGVLATWRTIAERRTQATP